MATPKQLLDRYLADGIIIENVSVWYANGKAREWVTYTGKAWDGVTVDLGDGKSILSYLASNPLPENW